MDVINELIMQTITSPWLYLIMLAVTIIDGFFPPVPSETVLVAAAAVGASTGEVNIPLICAIAAVGAAVGDNIAYWIGRRLGTERFTWMRRRRVVAAFAHAAGALDRSGAALILGARYVPVGRVAVNMTAGALEFPWRRFAPLSVLAGATWSLFSVAIGLLAGAWVKDQPLLSAVIGIALALLVGFAIDRTAAARRRAKQLQLAG